MKKTLFSIPVITPDKGLDRWAIIDGLIRDYTRVHPEEMREWVETIRDLRQQKKRASAVSGEGSMRHALALPMGLAVLLKKWFPDLFADKKQMLRFMRRYQGFRIPEKV